MEGGKLNLESKIKTETMKTTKNILVALALVAALISCRDKAAEKKIAELEARLNQMENGKTPSSTNPTPTTIPGITETPTPAVTPAADQKPEGPLPTLEFEKMDHDFGVVTEGQKVTYTYKFKNTGQAPLIVQNAAPSCGCTVPDWTREPIPVGGSGFVKAEFDTKGKVGPNTKTITVTANTWPKQTTLKFKASVTAAANAVGPAQ
jgi:Protein of unknown function (DUF1573)